jgi:hypothetical protein
MKIINAFIFALGTILSLIFVPTACTSEVPTADIQQGEFSISLTAADIHTELQTRTSISGVDINNFYVSLNDAEGISFMENKQFATITGANCILPAATGYELLVESCTESEATTLNNGFGAYRFVGSATFDILAGEITPVAVNCVLQNAGLQIEFDESFTAKFPIYAVTTQDTRALVFNSDNQGIAAYYDVPDELVLSLRITGSSGGWDDRLDVARQVELQKGKIIKLHVTYSVASGARIIVNKSEF